MENKILVIDDEKQIRKLLHISLESEGYKIIDAVDGKSGLDRSAIDNPDLIILDLGLPDLSGLDVLKKLREWYFKPIIILSVMNETNIIVDGLNMGADDYITKPFEVNELLARICACFRRYNFINDNINTNSNNILYFENIRIDLTRRLVFKNDVEIHLTKTEYELLKYFVRNRGKILTSRQILKTIWGQNVSQDLQYVKVYIRYLRQKIEDDHNDPKYIQTVLGVGYRII